MSQLQRNDRHRHLMMALFFLLASIYMLTYSGRLQFNDELQMLDITGSIVDFSDERYDLAMWYVWTNYGPLGGDGSQQYALPQSPIEPVQSILGIPFYGLAQAVERIGIVHAVWMVNVLVCAAIGTLFFRYALLLGYDYRTSTLAALALGLGTVLWPYSRTFLREPATTFLLLLTAYLLELARQRRPSYALAAIIAFTIASFTKESAVMMLPALAAIGFPIFDKANGHSHWQRVLDIGFVVLLILPVVLVFTELAKALIPQEIILTDFYVLQSTYTREALHTYLFSVGGSIWGTSPIVLLALPGVWMLYRDQQRRYIWVAALSVIGLAVGHAVTAGAVWSGGATWPPRFIIPALPFLMLAALHAIHALQRASRRWQMAAVVLVVYSLWWQISALAFSWFAYFDLLPEESNGLAEWGAGLNTLRHMRPTVLAALWFKEPLDFAWIRGTTLVWPLVFVLFAVVAGFMLVRFSRYVWGLPIMFIVVTGYTLTVIRDDPLYLGDREALHRITAILDEVEQPLDVVLLNSPQYHWFYLNHSSPDEARIVTLPLAPGERGSYEEAPEVVFDDPAELLGPDTIDLIRALALPRKRLWLLMDAGPFLPWRIRPVERYMVDNYYPVRELNPEPPDPAVRLLEFDTTPALRFADGILEATDLAFGGSLLVASIMLPQGTTYQAGDTLPLTLFWQTTEPLEQNYHVALFLADDDGVVFVENQPVQGWDTPPAAGFSPMPDWEPGAFIKDNRALRLPDTLPSGEYELWLRLYTPESGGTDFLPVSGSGIVGDGLAALPIRVMIQ